MPIREISRRTGLSRNTIRKYLRADIVEPSFQGADTAKQAGSVCGETVGLVADGAAQIAQRSAHRQADACGSGAAWL